MTIMEDIAKDFTPVAVRDDRMGSCVVSYNPKSQEFLIAISGKLAGPFTLQELTACMANIKDVIDLRGRYMYIDSYDVFGSHKK